MKSLPYLIIVLLALSLQSALAGDYQTTKDGKTLVWNNRPQPNDVASWSGEKDGDGYATGYGTLTWYASGQQVVIGSNIPKTKLIVSSRYTGKMVHGKLEGPVVNLDADGKTYHGTFANGHKTSDWSAGPPSKDETRVARATTTPKPDQDQDAATPKASESASPVAEKSDGPIVETPAEGPRNDSSSSRAANRRPPQPPPAENSSAGNNPPTHDVDDSLRSLVGPPPALPNSVTLQTPPPPPPSSPAPAASIAAKPAVRLSGTRAGTIADAEARAQGYNVNDYRRSEAIYNPTEESWAVSYEQTTANGGGKRFTVTISDKNEKATISGR